MVVAKEELDTLLNHEGTQSLFLDTFSTQFSLSGYKEQKKLKYITDADCVCNLFKMPELRGQLSKP